MYLDSDLSIRRRDRLRRCRRHHNQFMQRHKRQRPTGRTRTDCGLRSAGRSQEATTGNATGGCGEQEGGEGNGEACHADYEIFPMRCPSKALILVLPRTTQVPPELEANVPPIISLYLLRISPLLLPQLSQSVRSDSPTPTGSPGRHHGSAVAFALAASAAPPPLLMVPASAPAWGEGCIYF